ncbi:hypothetical protein DF186_21210, partial [Enterococcus hirae]
MFGDQKAAGAARPRVQKYGVSNLDACQLFRRQSDAGEFAHERDPQIGSPDRPSRQAVQPRQNLADGLPGPPDRQRPIWSLLPT